MYDAERLMAPFIPAISATVFAVAPERAQELVDDVFDKVPWTILFAAKDDKDTFIAHPTQKLIEARFSGLLSLWAVANAALLFANEMMIAVRQGKDTIDANPQSPAGEAQAYIAVARDLIRAPVVAWPASLSEPDINAELGSHSWYVNQLFLAATAWILLHEVAHVHLAHEAMTTADLRIKQENEADEWATQWILEKAPEDLRRDFRSVACAVGLIWVGLSDEIHRGLTTHPHASQRLTACSRFFPSSVTSPAMEMALHILKAVFDPHTSAIVSEHPAEAFDQILHWFRNSSRR